MTTRTRSLIILALALLVAGGLALPTAAGAASKPTAVPTATATSTPAPTQTARVQIVFATPQPSPSPTPRPSPTPSPSPTPAATIGGAISSDGTCGPTGLHIPLPLGNGLCIDLWGVIHQGFSSVWNGLVTILATQIHALTDAIMGPLTRTDNPTANAGLVAVENTLATDAGDAFAVVFGIAVLWTMKPAWFGNVAQGVALLWRSGLVLAALAAYNTLVNVWLGAVNGLASDIGASTMHDMGHSGIALLLAPLLLIIVGIERAVTLHVFAFVYEIGPLAIILFAWPPAADVARAWLRAFAYLSLLGPAYALMLSVIVSLEGQGNGRAGGIIGAVLWNDLMLVGGLLVLALVPGIVAALLSAVSHAGAGGLQKVIGIAKFAAL